MHAEREVHETSLREANFTGITTGWTAHLLPFQDSASG